MERKCSAGSRLTRSQHGCKSPEEMQTFSTWPQVVLPRGGGRLLLASDGLWDSVTPKTALHHVRGLPASKAAAELVRLLRYLPLQPHAFDAVVPEGLLHNVP